MSPRWRYFAWIGGTLSAVAIAAAAAQAALTLHDVRAALLRTHTERLQSVAGSVERQIAQMREGLLEVLSEIDASRLGETDRRDAELFRLLRRESTVMRLVLIDEHGRIERTLDRLRPDTASDVVAPPEVMAAVLKGQPRTVFHKDVDPRLLLAARRPGERRRTLLAELALTPLDALLAQAAGRGETAYLLDATGRVLAHGDARHPRGAGVRIEDAGTTWRALSQASRPLLLDTLVTPDGGKAVVSTMRVDAIGAHVVLEIDAAIAFEAVTRSLRAGVAVVGASLLAAVALSWLLSRRIARPIRAIEAAAGRIGAGDFDMRLNAAAQGELAPLAHSINRLAERIGQAQAELERRVEERTRQLDGARVMAEEANRAKTRFIAAASHDLRQPLHGVGVLATLIERRAGGDELGALARRLSQAVAAMNAFLMGLLDLSRLDSGVVRVERQALRLGPLLQAVGQRFVDADPGAGRLRVVDSRAVVESDPLLLERIVQNLVGNALRYGAGAPVLLGVRRRSGMACIEVHDGGPGIAPEHRAAVFEEFWRGPASAGEPGLGLGLAIVRRYADLLGHRVAVGRSPLGGACLAVHVALAADPLPQRAPIPHEQRSALDGLFVLVVDDDRDILQWTASLLQGSGCHVVTAVSAAAAEAALAEHLRPPDVIVSDLRFAGCPDGYAQVRALRERLDAAMPILLVSGDAEGLLDASADARLVKPAAPAVLLRTLAGLTRAAAAVTR